MATVTMTGCNVNLNSNESGKIVTTFLSGQTAGVRVISVLFENDSGSNVYLTPNGAGKTFSINVRGVNPSTGAVNQEVTIKSFTINTNGSGYAGTLGNNGLVTNPSSGTVFTGNIQLCVYINQQVGAPTGFIGSGKLTFTYLTKPTVSAGSVITKTQMDALRSFYDNTPTAVTQYDTAKASVATTYKSATAGNSISASWYNS